jgi:hypothetical protein
MEKIMSKTNETSKLATFEHHNTLADSELVAVAGGWPGAFFGGNENAEELAFRNSQDAAAAAACITFKQLFAM